MWQCHWHILRRNFMAILACIQGASSFVQMDSSSRLQGWVEGDAASPTDQWGFLGFPGTGRPARQRRGFLRTSIAFMWLSVLCRWSRCRRQMRSWRRPSSRARRCRSSCSRTCRTRSGGRTRLRPTMKGLPGASRGISPGRLQPRYCFRSREASCEASRRPEGRKHCSARMCPSCVGGCMGCTVLLPDACGCHPVLPCSAQCYSLHQDLAAVASPARVACLAPQLDQAQGHRRGPPEH